MTGRFSCARECRERAEPLFATASTVGRWLLVEQPGPWGRDALDESRLPGETAAALAERAAAFEARVLLLRRFGRNERGDEPVSCYVAHTAPGNSWVESFELERPAQLLDVDLTALRGGGSVGGRPVPHPLFLVCTNGSHDPCCAEFGRPLAAALDAARPAAAWECSHMGGDRFAANLLCFPHGVYYGQLEPDAGVEVAAAYEEGRLDLEHYRGRSCHPFVVQAADFFIRRTAGLVRIDAIEFESAARLDKEGMGDRFEVTFMTPTGDRFVATLRRQPAARAQRLTCHAPRPGHPPRYDLLDLAGPGLT